MAGQVVCDRSPHGCLEFLLCNEHSFVGSEIRNVWLLWLAANSLSMETCVLMLLMFSFNFLVRAIKEIVLLADVGNPYWIRTSGNLNFCHLTAERWRLPGRSFPAGTGGEAKQSLFRVLLCHWNCALHFAGDCSLVASPVPDCVGAIRLWAYVCAPVRSGLQPGKHT